MSAGHAYPRSSQTAREAIATFATYEQAERAVDWLSDHGFTVDRVSIVGTGISIVERVTGRVTTVRAALNGAAQGAFVALLFTSLVAVIFTVAEGFWVLALTTLAFGVVFGAAFAAVLHASQGGRRDFASTSRFSADRFEVYTDMDVAAEARRVLESMPPSDLDESFSALRAA